MWPRWCWRERLETAFYLQEWLLPESPRHSVVLEGNSSTSSPAQLQAPRLSQSQSSAVPSSTLLSTDVEMGACSCLDCGEGREKPSLGSLPRETWVRLTLNINMWSILEHLVKVTSICRTHWERWFLQRSSLASRVVEEASKVEIRVGVFSHINFSWGWLPQDATFCGEKNSQFFNSRNHFDPCLLSKDANKIWFPVLGSIFASYSS